MMARPQNPNIAQLYRRCSTGHATVLPKPAPDRSDQRKSIIKAEIMSSDDLCLGSLTCQIIFSVLSHPVKHIAQPSNPHSSKKPNR